MGNPPGKDASVSRRPNRWSIGDREGGEAMSDDSATAIKCPLCAVTVPADKVDLPNRCLHPRCPLHRDQSKWVRPSDKTFDGDDLGSTITLSSNAICATLWRRWIVQYARHASDAVDLE
jgi:hypothetical protein